MRNVEAPRSGRVDAALVALSLGLGLLASVADYSAIEQAVGLIRTQEGWDAYNARVAARMASPPPAPWRLRLCLAWTRAAEHAAAFLVVATIGAGATALARSRSIRGAGAIAVAALAPWLAFCVAAAFLIRRFPGESFGFEGTFHIWTEVAEPIGGALLATWVLLAVGRSWRVEPSTIDRAGRAIAVAWLAYGLADNLLLPLASG